MSMSMDPTIGVLGVFLGTNYNSDVDESFTVLSSTDVVENNKQLIDASGNANDSNLSSTCTAAWDEIPPAIEVNSKMEESLVFSVKLFEDGLVSVSAFKWLPPWSTETAVAFRTFNKFLIGATPHSTSNDSTVRIIMDSHIFNCL
ncbi:Ap-5 complex subunit beta-like protein, partial [Thalictrum thalictroides]